MVLFFFVDIVVVLFFRRNSTFELVVDCMRAGLKKKAGCRGGAQPPARGGWGGRSTPPFANVLAFSPTTSFEKRFWSINSRNKHNSTTEISRPKMEQA